ncbi:DarT ssDNA thymidine ADP-ribosyltransferase family protein [Pseudophaeobacter arcticus]|jgi:hypothetical protein|uniref:DarT ssDNA thymidine ADP-ribosyltransferase family protein n=1 Tax=Pseudophaeobacter arcticus TaxID=385492 RepID=UPI0039E4A58E
MNLDQLISLIRQNKRHNYIYHFTDNSNFPWIHQYGLLSKDSATLLAVPVPRPGGDAQSRISDSIRGISNDVSMCLTMNHPMAFRCRQDGRHPSQYYLGVDPEVLRTPGVRVALGLANAHTTEIIPIDEAIERIDIDVLYRWVEPPEFLPRIRAAERIEVLVPSGIPKELIKKKFKP